jgi:hypothetical protein
MKGWSDRPIGIQIVTHVDRRASKLGTLVDDGKRDVIRLQRDIRRIL